MGCVVHFGEWLAKASIVIIVNFTYRHDAQRVVPLKFEFRKLDDRIEEYNLGLELMTTKYTTEDCPKIVLVLRGYPC